MSYPRKLHILIVEDDQTPIDAYRELLETYRDECPSVEPTIVRSYADAEELLKGTRIFHCVILDLNLPLANREVAPEGLAPGELLLELASNRDDYPIPVLLVISGKLETASLMELHARLARAFWHGALIGKKDPKLPEELRKGLQKAQEYVDIGIHIQDSGNNWFPTLAPREDDLLRRCVLAKTGCLGVDLEWWSAEQGPSCSRPTVNDGPTKVLMGRFLLDDGMESSRPTFFKFEPAGNAAFVCRDVAILDHKLSHVKVQHSSASRSRCLLVTQSVTDSRPVSLHRILYSDDVSFDAVIPHLVSDIAMQLEKLGGIVEDFVMAAGTLWRSHDIEKVKQSLLIAGAGLNYGSNETRPDMLLDEVRKSTARIWVSKRNCIHGDLNATNVAVDVSSPDRPHAFVFDAAGVHADIDTRDFAVLELTTLLFANDLGIQSQFERFRHFYSDKIDPGILPEAPTFPIAVRRTASLISAIRHHVSTLKNAETYPLVLFDTAILQLGGLAIQAKGNKVANPELTCVLATWIAAWLKQSMPQLFTDSISSCSLSTGSAFLR